MLYEYDGKQPAVGKESYVSAIAHVIGDVSIGDNCYIGHGAVIHAAMIADLAVIGMSAVLSLFSQVGIKTIIAEGSVVKMEQTIPDGVVAAGNPARVIRAISPKDIERWNMGKELYINLAKQYLEKPMRPL